MAPRRKSVAVIDEPIRKPEYFPSDPIWVQWHGMYYKAKILEKGIENDGQYYNIHYWKFSKSWDSTVSESRIFPCIPENNLWVEKQNKEYRRKVKEQKNTMKYHKTLKEKKIPVSKIPPYLYLDRVDLSKYKYKVYKSEDRIISKSEIPSTSGIASPGIPSTSDKDINMHVEQKDPDGNDHVVDFGLNTSASDSVPVIDHDNTEIKLEVDEQNVICEQHSIDNRNDVVEELNSLTTTTTMVLKRKNNTTEKGKEKKRKNELIMIHNSKDLNELNGDDLSEESKIQKTNISIFQKEANNHNEDLDEHVPNENIGSQFNCTIDGGCDTFNEGINTPKLKKKKKKSGVNFFADIDPVISCYRRIVEVNHYSNGIDSTCDRDETKNSHEKIDNDAGGLNIEEASTSTSHSSESNIDIQNNDIASQNTNGDELNIEEASSSSITVSEANFQNETFNLAGGSTEEVGLIIEEACTLPIVTETNDENISAPYTSTEVSRTFNHCTSNENSCGSSFTPVSNSHMGSDDENDELITLDDDDQYVKNRKVSKKKLDDDERRIYEEFSYEKPYSRAAKNKANEAISQMSKPPLGKEKKSSNGKRPKNGKKKDDDEPSNFVALNRRDLKLNNYYLQVFLQDYHLLLDDRYMPVAPSKVTVFDILSEYTKHSSADLKILAAVIKVFDAVFESLIIYSIEIPRHIEIVQNSPTLGMAYVYGLPHLARFIYHLPTILSTIEQAKHFNKNIIEFMQGFTDYMEYKGIELTFDLYENTLPEYVRSSFLPHTSYTSL